MSGFDFPNSGWSGYIIPMKNERYFVPGWLVYPLYATGHLDQVSYDRYMSCPKVLNAVTRTLVKGI